MKDVKEFVDGLLGEEPKKMAPTAVLVKSTIKGDYTNERCKCTNTGWHEPGRCANYLKKGQGDLCVTCSAGKI